MFLLQNTSSGALYAAALILIAASTDLFDGMLARKLGQVTEIGKIIDPLADKIAVAVVAFVLVFQAKIPFWFFCLALSRDLLIFLGGIHITRKQGIILQSNQTGKWAVTSVAFYLLLAVLDRPEIIWCKELFLLSSGCLLIVSFVFYLRRYIEVVRGDRENRVNR